MYVKIKADIYIALTLQHAKHPIASMNTHVGGDYAHAWYI